jgi:hypothetical protein
LGFTIAKPNLLFFLTENYYSKLLFIANANSRMGTKYLEQ